MCTYRVPAAANKWKVEIPTGLPLLYDAKHKRIRVLDDGSGLDPLERYNFGKATDLLFREGAVAVPLPPGAEGLPTPAAGGGTVPGGVGGGFEGPPR